MPIQDTELSATELHLKQECIGAASENAQVKADVDISRVDSNPLGAAYQAKAHGAGMAPVTGVGNSVALALKNLLERLPIQ